MSSMWFDPDVAIIGGGIMSATVAVMLKRLEPRLRIQVFEAADELHRKVLPAGIMPAQDTQVYVNSAIRPAAARMVRSMLQKLLKSSKSSSYRVNFGQVLFEMEFLKGREISSILFPI